MRTIRKRLLALLLTAAMLGTLFTGLPLASAASEALGNVTDAAVDGNVLLLTIDSGGSASDLLTLEVCQDNILRVDYQPESVEPSPDTPIIDPELTWDTTTATEIDITGDPIVIQTDGMRIEISRTPCRMTVMQADGTTLFWEPESGGIYHDGCASYALNPAICMVFMDLTASAIMGTFCGTTTALRPQQGSREIPAAHLCGQLPDMVFWWTLTAAIPIQTPPTARWNSIMGGTPARAAAMRKKT